MADTPLSGRYRLWSGVSLHGRLLYSARPLSVTRLNDAAVEVVEALTRNFQSPAEVSRTTGRATESVAHLLERLHRRGFLEWAPAKDMTHIPPVSIVITVRNDREHLRDCLDALTSLDYPDYEVVVIDDGSTDDTNSMAHAHPLSDCGRLKVVSVGTPDDPLGIGASRNHGVAVAQYDVIAFTDADCRPRPDWLSDLVPCLAVHDLIGGRVQPHGSQPVDSYEGINSSLDMGEYATRIDPDGATPYLPTANLVGLRTVFETVPFPERNIAEDVDVCWRALDQGFDVVYTPTGIVEHDYRANLRAFGARRTDYGASEALLARIYQHGNRVALPLEPLIMAIILFVAFAGGLSSSVLLALATVGSIALIGLSIVRILRRYRSLRTVVPVATVLRSYGRSVLSTGYVLSQELARYYSVPFALVGVVLVPIRPAVGMVVLGAVLVGIIIPVVVEYATYQPVLSLLQYARFYFADHLGYQRGVYRGVIEYRTVTHLTPLARFRPTGPTAAILSILAARIISDTNIRTVSLGDYTARFRITTSAERWWFDADDLRGERPVLEDFLENVRDDDVVFDVGANIGLYTCFFGQAVSAGQVVAFEPQSTNADRLVENVELNGVDAQIHRLALGRVNSDRYLRTRADEAGVGDHALHPLPNSKGESRLERSGESTPKNSGASIPEGSAEPVPSDYGDYDRSTIHEVPVVSGDSFCNRDEVPHPTVVKIDVEGEELAVLQGLDRTLSDPTCRMVYCEIHPKALAKRGVRAEDVEQFLKNRGFVCEPLDQVDDRYFLFARCLSSEKN